MPRQTPDIIPFYEDIRPDIKDNKVPCPELIEFKGQMCERGSFIPDE